MKKFNLINDLRGQQINNFNVLEIDYDKSKEKGKIYYICMCNCKNQTIKSIRSDVLISKKIKSCGCLKPKYYCSICGSSNKVVFSIDYNSYLCNKHYMQFYHTEEIKNRFMKDKNEIIVKDKYAEIILYNKKHEEKTRTLIDLDDVDKCKNYKWGLTSNNYVISKISKDEYILLHRYILGLESNGENLEGDHIDHNTLDNRKENLRKATESQNNMNAFKPINNTSGVKGISWSKRDSLWHVYIGINNKRVNLGWFQNFEDAVKCRLEAEEKYYKEYSIYHSNAIGGYLIEK